MPRNADLGQQVTGKLGRRLRIIRGTRSATWFDLIAVLTMLPVTVGRGLWQMTPTWFRIVFPPIVTIDIGIHAANRLIAAFEDKSVYEKKIDDERVPPPYRDLETVARHIDFGLETARGRRKRLKMSGSDYYGDQAPPPAIAPPPPQEYSIRHFAKSQIVPGAQPHLFISLDKFGKGGYRGDRFHHLLMEKDAQRIQEFDFLWQHGADGIKKYGTMPNHLEGRTGSNNEFIDFTSSGDRAYGSFNSLLQLYESRNLLFKNGNLDFPTYESTSLAAAMNDPITDQFDSNNLCVLRNQKLDIYLKNITSNTTSDATKPSETNAEVYIYVLQCIKDIYHNDDSVNRTFQRDLEHAFANAFEYAAADTRLGENVEQPVWTNYATIYDKMKENGYKPIVSKHVTLAPGQEINIHVRLNKPQVLSYKFLAKSKPCGLISSGPDVVDYRPIVKKKGEMFMFYVTKGGLGWFDTDTVEHEKVQLIMKGTFRYRISGLSEEMQKNKLSITDVIPSVTTQNPTDDAGHHN